MQFEQVAQKIEPGSRVVAVTKLAGGISAEVTAVTILLKNSTARAIVVRQYGQADLAHNPHIAETEYKLLSILQYAGLSTPKPYLFDESNTILPSPYIVTEFIEGETVDHPSDVADFAKQLARALAAIHKVGERNTDLSFLPTQENVVAIRLQEKSNQPDEVVQESKIRAALEAHKPSDHGNKPTLLHGDFWQGNTLWQKGELRSVIDWEDANVGDPLADVANAHLELLLGVSEEAAQHFKDEYFANEADLDTTNLAYWELVAALRVAASWKDWDLEEIDIAAFQTKFNAFVDQALAKLEA